MKALDSCLVIFDLDGTLIDSAGDICLAVNGLLAELDCAPLSVAEVRGFVGEGARRLVEKLLVARPDARTDVDSALARFLHLYETTPTTHTTLYPDLRPTLEALIAAGATLAVCTNKPGTATRNVLRDLDLARYFETVIAGDTLPVRKPDPGTIDAVIALNGHATKHVVLVGDSEIDAATAIAAEIPFILMTHGYRHKPAAEIPATYRLDHFTDLIALLPVRAGLC